MMEGSDEVIRNLNNWAKRQRAASLALAENWGGQLEGRAKTNAPWADRTSNARNGLFGSVEDGNDAILIRLSHSIEYGVFLELANDGRFAILKPTIDAAIPEVVASYKKLWE